MALNIGEVLVHLSANTAGFNRNMTVARSTLTNFSRAGASVSTTMKMSFVSAAASVVALGGAAVQSSMSFNKAMANIGTMIPGNQKRLGELKKDIMALAGEFGLSSDTIAEGVYQTISAFGDSAETMNKVRTAAKFAVAGVTDVKTATSLLATVTRGYGDTSQKAYERAADLAFIAAQGITTPEELARAIPRAVPAAVELGVRPEELFAAFGTLSGITGTAAEVGTQLEAVFRALLVPPEELKPVMAMLADRLIQQQQISGPLVDTYTSMTKQMDLLREQYSKASESDAPKYLKRLQDMKKQSLDAAGGLGSVIVKSMGLNTTMTELSKSVGGNTSELGRMLGRMEGMNAALQLGGPQAENYAKMLGNMNKTGLTPLTTSLAEQTDGINKTGHEWEKFKVKASNAMIELGDLLGPVFGNILDWLTRVSSKFGETRRVFEESGWAAALKPSVDAVLALFKSLTLYDEIASGVGKALSSAWTTMRDSAASAWAVVAPGFESFGNAYADWARSWNKKYLFDPWDGIKASAANGWNLVRPGFSTLWTNITTFFANTWTYSVAGMGTLWDGVRASAASGWDSVKSGFAELQSAMFNWFAGLWSGSVSGMGSLWTGIKASAANGWESVRSGFSGLWTSITTFFQNTWNYIVNILNGDTGLWAGIKNAASNAWSTIWSGFNTLWTNISNWFSQLASSGYAWGVNLFQRFWDGIKSWLGISGSGSSGGTTSFSPPKLAAGGIVNRPTLAMIGEAGPEAVIPLGRMGGGGTMVNNFYISGSGNPDSVAEAIVQRLKLKGIRVV